MVHRSGSFALIRACLVRALVVRASSRVCWRRRCCRRRPWRLPAAIADDGYQLPTRAMKELSPEMLTLLAQKNMPKDSPILVRIFKEESELEVWKQDTDRPVPAAEGLSDLPLVGRAWPEDKRRRSSGARRLLLDHARPDESELQLLPRHQYRLPQRLRQSQRLYRRVPDDPRRLLVARLLRHDRRADRRNLFAGARSRSSAARRHFRSRPIRSA